MQVSSGGHTACQGHCSGHLRHPIPGSQSQASPQKGQHTPPQFQLKHFMSSQLKSYILSPPQCQWTSTNHCTSPRHTDCSSQDSQSSAKIQRTQYQSPLTYHQRHMTYPSIPSGRGRVRQYLKAKKMGKKAYSDQMPTWQYYNRSMDGHQYQGHHHIPSISPQDYLQEQSNASTSQQYLHKGIHDFSQSSTQLIQMQQPVPTGCYNLQRSANKYHTHQCSSMKGHNTHYGAQHRDVYHQGDSFVIKGHNKSDTPLAGHHQGHPSTGGQYVHSSSGAHLGHLLTGGHNNGPSSFVGAHHGHPSVTSTDHGYPSVTKADHGHSSLTGADHGYPSVTKADHGQSSLPGAHQGYPSVTKSDHGHSSLTGAHQGCTYLTGVHQDHSSLTDGHQSHSSSARGHQRCTYSTQGHQGYSSAIEGHQGHSSLTGVYLGNLPTARYNNDHTSFPGAYMGSSSSAGGYQGHSSTEGHKGHASSAIGCHQDHSSSSRGYPQQSSSTVGYQGFSLPPEAHQGHLSSTEAYKIDLSTGEHEGPLSLKGRHHKGQSLPTTEHHDHSSPIGGYQDNSLLIGGYQDNSLPIGGYQDNSLPIGGHQDHSSPIEGYQDNSLPIGGHQDHSSSATVLRGHTSSTAGHQKYSLAPGGHQGCSSSIGVPSPQPYPTVPCTQHQSHYTCRQNDLLRFTEPSCEFLKQALQPQCQPSIYNNVTVHSSTKQKSSPNHALPTEVLNRSSKQNSLLNQALPTEMFDRSSKRKLPSNQALPTKVLDRRNKGKSRPNQTLPTEMFDRSSKRKFPLNQALLTEVFDRSNKGKSLPYQALPTEVFDKSSKRKLPPNQALPTEVSKVIKRDKPHKQYASHHKLYPPVQTQHYEKCLDVVALMDEKDMNVHNAMRAMQKTWSENGIDQRITFADKSFIIGLYYKLQLQNVLDASTSSTVTPKSQVSSQPDTIGDKGNIPSNAPAMKTDSNKISILRDMRVNANKETQKCSSPEDDYALTLALQTSECINPNEWQTTVEELEESSPVHKTPEVPTEQLHEDSFVACTPSELVLASTRDVQPDIQRSLETVCQSERKVSSTAVTPSELSVLLSEEPLTLSPVVPPVTSEGHAPAIVMDPSELPISLPWVASSELPRLPLSVGHSVEHTSDQLVLEPSSTALSDIQHASSLASSLGFTISHEDPALEETCSPNGSLGFCSSFTDTTSPNGQPRVPALCEPDTHFEQFSVIGQHATNSVSLDNIAAPSLEADLTIEIDKTGTMLTETISTIYTDKRGTMPIETISTTETDKTGMEPKEIISTVEADTTGIMPIQKQISTIKTDKIGMVPIETMSTTETDTTGMVPKEIISTIETDNTGMVPIDTTSTIGTDKIGMVPKEIISTIQTDKNGLVPKEIISTIETDNTGMVPIKTISTIEIDKVVTKSLETVSTHLEKTESARDNVVPHPPASHAESMSDECQCDTLPIKIESDSDDDCMVISSEMFAETTTRSVFPLPQVLPIQLPVIPSLEISKKLDVMIDYFEELNKLSERVKIIDMEQHQQFDRCRCYYHEQNSVDGGNTLTLDIISCNLKSIELFKSSLKEAQIKAINALGNLLDYRLTKRQNQMNELTKRDMLHLSEQKQIKYKESIQIKEQRLLNYLNEKREELKHKEDSGSTTSSSSIQALDMPEFSEARNSLEDTLVRGLRHQDSTDHDILCSKGYTVGEDGDCRDNCSTDGSLVS